MWTDLAVTTPPPSDVWDIGVQVAAPVAAFLAATGVSVRMAMWSWNRSIEMHEQADELSESIASMARTDLIAAREQWASTETDLRDRISVLEARVIAFEQQRQQWSKDRADWTIERAHLSMRVTTLEAQISADRDL